MLHITRSHASFVSAFYPQNNCSVYVATINIRLHVSHSPPQHTAECSSGAALDLQVALKLTCWEVLMWRDDLLAGNFCCCCWSGAATFSAFQKRSWIMSILSKGINSYFIPPPPYDTKHLFLIPKSLVFRGATIPLATSGERNCADWLSNPSYSSQTECRRFFFFSFRGNIMTQNGNNVSADVLPLPLVSSRLSASKQTNHSCSADIGSDDTKDRK